MGSDSFLKLMQAFDSLFPIGTFTMSNGMETYVQKSLVYDKKTLTNFLDEFIYTLPYNDLGFAAKAAQGEDFRLLDEICTAAKSPYELRNGSQKLCARFLKAENALGEYHFMNDYFRSITENECQGNYSIAVGLFILDTGVEISHGLEMYCYSMLSSMVNHAVKLVPLRQLDGQQCLAQAIEKIPLAVQKSLETEIEDLGISDAGFDLRSMEHEVLYSRLYIS